MAGIELVTTSPSRRDGFGYARTRGLRDADAADLAAAVLRDVARTAGRPAPDSDSVAFGGRLYALTHRALDAARTGATRPGGRGTRGPAPAPAAEADPDWQAEWLRRLAAEAMGRVEPEFPPTTWGAFWETAVNGRSAADVGPELAMTAGAVHVARCRVLSLRLDPMAG